jgi:hypothetical protein
MLMQASLVKQFWRGVAAAKLDYAEAGSRARRGEMPNVLVRQEPVPFATITALLDEMTAAARQTMDSFFAGVRAPPVRQAPPECGRLEPPSDAFEILTLADDYLDKVPGQGAMLADLIDNIAMLTRYDTGRIGAVIRRNFQSNGTLVWRSRDDRGTYAGIVAQMKAGLLDHGYSDVRENYPLTAISTRRDRAALLAFDGSKAVVLCYPVYLGVVADPMVRQAALFQAGAVSTDQTGHFVWVSDGVDDFFYDFHARTAIDRLPRRPASTGAPP